MLFKGMANIRVLVVQFYKPFIYYHLLFTSLSLYLLLSKGAVAFILAMPLKLIGYAGSVFYQYYFYRHEYFYYRNAGITVKRLYAYTNLPDFLVYLILAGLSIYLFNHYVKG